MDVPYSDCVHVACGPDGAGVLLGLHWKLLDSILIKLFLAGTLVVYIEQAYPWYSSPLEPEKP